MWSRRLFLVFSISLTPLAMAATTAPASAAALSADSASLMKRLTSLAEVNRALAEVASRERAVDAKLQTLLSGRAELEAGLAAIEDDTKNVRERASVGRDETGRDGEREREEESVENNLETWFRSSDDGPTLTFKKNLYKPFLQSISALRSDAEHLAESIASTASLSERVSRKVRQLDAAQSRVREALTHIDAAVGRAEAVEGLRKAMATDDYEAAAAAIASFSDLEERFVVPAASAHAHAAAAAAAGTSAAARGDDRAVREQHEVRTRLFCFPRPPSVPTHLFPLFFSS